MVVNGNSCFEKKFVVRGIESEGVKDRRNDDQDGETTTTLLNTYVKVQPEDVASVVVAIVWKEGADMLRVLFGVKALKKMVCSGDQNVIVHIVKKCPDISARLVYLLRAGIFDNVEFHCEILWSLTNLVTFQNP